MNMMASRWCKLYKGTPAEHALEDAVGSLGIPYRNQFPCFLYGARYYPDFLLPTIGLVIEVDDPSHSTPEKRALDEQRTEAMHQMYGWRVVRCTNEEATSDPHGTVRRLLVEAGVWPLPSSLPRLADSLPRVASCPKKNRASGQQVRREQKLEARLERRRRKQGPRGQTDPGTSTPA